MRVVREYLESGSGRKESEAGLWPSAVIKPHCIAYLVADDLAEFVGNSSSGQSCGESAWLNYPELFSALRHIF